MRSNVKLIAAAALGAAVSAWVWSDLSKDEKPGALFLIAEDQAISARAFCRPGQKEPACSLSDLGVGDFDRQLITDLKLNPLCNGFPIFLDISTNEAVKSREFMGPKSYLYVDCLPGQSFAEWSLYYERGYGTGLRGLFVDLTGRPRSETMRPLLRGSIVDMASEACSLANLKRGN